jgi:hypothetical protein
VKEFKGDMNRMDAIDTPYINSNLIKSVYIEFHSENETTFSWMREETCLALSLLDVEMRVVLQNFGSNCILQIHVDGKVFETINEDFIEYILINNSNNLVLVSNKPIKDFLASHVRWVNAPNTEDNYDEIYLECIRDIR